MNGQLRIHNKVAEITINGRTIKQIEVDKVERTLGVQLSLSLKWDKQYEKIMEKMSQAIIKLQKTVVEVGLIYLYFNAYLLKSVFFGCGVVNLSNEQQMKL